MSFNPKLFDPDIFDMLTLFDPEIYDINIFNDAQAETTPTPPITPKSVSPSNIYRGAIFRNGHPLSVVVTSDGQILLKIKMRK